MAETLAYVNIWNCYCQYFDWSRHEILSYYGLESPSEKKDFIIDITVSYYGLWQKRWHMSLYGISIVVDILTGLFIDYEILSRYCPECTTAKRDLGEHSADGTKPTRQNTAKTVWAHQMPWKLKMQKFMEEITCKLQHAIHECSVRWRYQDMPTFIRIKCIW
ncbi:hypothetical protein AVEN_176258-1 [Araneus ventricosus]|uniref:Uncharacterized protein n=1 Tax=Araneus ventricosus TaxID=182803 RepID=A0A4Y2U3Z9_ARAVE|nr:hypothetical protein AVEN_176258-1 [Araneus ventricosus]